MDALKRFLYWLYSLNQAFFIRERDEKLRNVLMTAATNHTEKYFLYMVDVDKKKRRPKEMEELEDEDKGLPKQEGELPKQDGEVSLWSMHVCCCIGINDA